MAGMNYNYDESASSWPYFVLTILVVLAIPLSYSYFSEVAQELSSQSSKLYENNGQIKSSKEYKTSIDGELLSFKAKYSASKIFSKKFFILLALYLSIIAIFIFSQSAAPQEFGSVFDPFEILDISSSATDREIRSHYRKLSLVFHPDKIARDSSEQEKKEMEAKFVLINKAYKALTDEVTKKNYEQYGHPDGPQDVSHGIALPSWLVDGDYSWILTILYIIAIAVLLPLGVGKWWTRVQSYTKKAIHIDTARAFTNRLVNHNPAHVVTQKEIFRLISQATEYELLFNNSKEPQEIQDMLLAYVVRDFSQYSTNEVLKLVAILPQLISGLIDIASIFRNTDLVLKSMEANKSIIQALSPSVSKYHQFLQLPHVKLDKIDPSFEVHTITKFFILTKEDQLKFLGLTESELKDVIEVASKIPYIKLVKAEFKVPGEDVIPPSSHAHLSIKLVVKSAGDKSSPVISKKSLVEEEDFQALKDPFKIVEDQPLVPPTFAPYFPKLNTHFNGWMCSLINQKDNKLADVPQHVQHLSLENLTKTPASVVGTFKLKLAATSPPDEGTYQFRCVLKSLDYFGNDLEFPVNMVVKNPPAPAVEKDAYEIEDPDEDSVAGVVAALKGEAVLKNHEYDSSSDEDASDSEYEQEESDFSDINTDTEDES